MNHKLTDFYPFPKMARLSRECIITEKLDGTNAQIFIAPSHEVAALGDLHSASLVTAKVEHYGGEELTIFAGSRNRWITPENDNYGFAGWVLANSTELCKLGPGRHYGEWWGHKIQRGYNMTHKRFSLFNAQRWLPAAPVTLAPEWVNTLPGVVDSDGNKCGCVGVVPVLYRGEFNTSLIEQTLDELRNFGSQAAPGFKDPEGIIVYHIAAGIGFKKTIKDDASPKSLV